MTRRLQIYDARERWLVRAADLCLAPLRWRPVRATPGPVRRVLMLRLERIGDLLMVRGALAQARAAWPTATLDLAVGSWNLELASRLPEVTDVLVADVPWLARHASADGWRALVAKARAWSARRYDLVLNFEPDIRSNAIAWLTGAPVRVGYASGGGSALLTDAIAYDPTRHVGANASALVARAAGAAHLPALQEEPLTIPEGARERASRWCAGLPRPLVGLHASGGRESKQWHVDRFAAVARELAAQRGASIVLTGAPADRPLVDRVAASLDGVPYRNACGDTTLNELFGVLAELDVFITGDTGPMHMAAAVGTPVVALFGPSDPARYGPAGDGHQILQVSLPCSPCGQVRRPPAHCRGHVPACLDGISVAAVVDAACHTLDRRAREREALR